MKNFKNYTQYSRQYGISLVLVVLLIAIISSIVLPMARTSILEVKISQNYNWVELAYTTARGENYHQSNPLTMKFDELLVAMANQSTALPSTLADHETQIRYMGQDGIPYGFSVDRFKGFQFDVITEAERAASGSYNQQYMGVTYVAKPN